MEKSPFLTFTREQQRAALEALLFASDDALSPRALYKLLIETDEQAARQDQPADGTPDGAADAPQETGADGANGEAAPESEAAPEGNTAGGQQKQPSRSARIRELTMLFEELIDELNGELDSTGRAFRIVRVAGGYQFATTPQHGELVARLVRSKSRRRLSQAALETLAIIAYRQPVTKPEIEAIRGVSCNEVVNTLLEKNLVTIAGRSDAIGKPLLYGTTDDFLRAFGLHDISDLPKPRELEELMERRVDILNTDAVVFAEGENVADFEERLQALGKQPDTPPADAAPDAEAAEQAQTIAAGEEQNNAAPDSGTPEPVLDHGQVEHAEPEATTETAGTETAGMAQEQPQEGQTDDMPEQAPVERKMRMVMAVNGRPL